MRRRTALPSPIDVTTDLRVAALHFFEEGAFDVLAERPDAAEEVLDFRRALAVERRFGLGGDFCAGVRA